MGLAVKDVADYGKAPREEPAIYPGARTGFSYLLRGGKVHELRVFGKVDTSRVEVDGVEKVLKDVLEELGEPPLEERYGVLAHGSNASPAQLSFKGLRNPVVVKCRLFDVAPAYAGFTSEFGYVPSTLSRMEGHESEVYLNLLTRKELDAMDRTEGRGAVYDLVELREGKVFLETGRTVEHVYAYVTTDAKGLYLKGGRPLLLDEVPQERMMDLAGRKVLSVGRTSDWLEALILEGRPERRFLEQI